MIKNFEHNLVISVIKVVGTHLCGSQRSPSLGCSDHALHAHPSVVVDAPDAPGHRQELEGLVTAGAV
jgi:hypothetical protein